MNTEDPIHMQFQRLVSGGKALLDEWQKEGVMESEILDFKLTEKGGTKLHDKDNKNLSKSLSGFANSGGGILVWGVECNRDKKGVDQIVALPGLVGLRSFHSSVLTNYPGFTSPGAQGVEVQSIDIGGDSGFLVMYIPKGESNPLMATAGDLHRYYYRSGPSFKPMPEWMVADRYGRRPQPKLKLAWKKLMEKPGDQTTFRLELGIANTGLGIAKDLCINTMYKGVSATYMRDESIDFKMTIAVAPANLDVHDSNRVWTSPGLVLHPGMIASVCVGEFKMLTLSKHPAQFPYIAICDGARSEGELILSYSALSSAKLNEWHFGFNIA